MKTSVAFLSFLTLLSLPVLAQKSTAPTSLPLAAKQPYQVGESLEYGIRYGLITAGKATLEVSEKVNRQGKSTYHMVGLGRSVGMAEWFFKTRDRYETFIDEQTLAPVEFIRDVNEGGFTINRHLVFNHDEQKVRDLLNPNKGNLSIEQHTQDIMSAFYFARHLNPAEWKKGDIITIDMFLDYEQFPFYLKFLGRENVDTEFGTIRCLKLQPSLQAGRVFSDDEDMVIWVSDDANKIPILIQSKLSVGSIKVELQDYDNLKHAIHFH